MPIINREEKIEEMKLRSLVRRGIKIILEKHKQQEQSNNFDDESKLRKIISNMILETSTADNDTAPNRSTGINVLEDLLKKIIPVIETDYKKLTTSEEQRDSFRAHTIQAVKNSLAPVRVNDQATSGDVTGTPEELEEQDDISISLDKDDTKPKEYEKEDFIDIGLKSDQPEKPKKEDEKQSFGIEGKDVTGRNVAYENFKKIEKAIIDAYDVLSNEEDRELFYDYLITNLKLYFDKFEKDLTATPVEPTTDEYEAAASPEAEESPAPGL